MLYKKIIFIFIFILSYSQMAFAITYGNGWSVYDNTPNGATVKVVEDIDVHQNVAQLSGSTMGNGYILGSFNDAKSWNNSEDNILRWRMKYNEEFVIYIKLKTQKGDRYLYYTPHNQNYGRSGDSIYIHHGLGVSAKDGTWRTFERNIEEDLKEFESDNSLISVNAFLIRGSGSVYGVEMFSKNSRVVYESGDQGNHWNIYDNTPVGASDIAVWDDETSSNIMTLNGSGTDNGYSLPINNNQSKILKWKMKFNEEYVIFVKLSTQNGVRYLYYTALNDSYGGLEYIHHGLGIKSKDGTWRTFTRDIEKDLKEFDSDNKLISIDSFLVRGSGKFDDIEMYNRVESSNSVLILYDTVGEFGHIGKENAIFLENLLGHFNLDITSKPANEYQSNDMSDKRAVFYIGTSFNAINQYAVGSDERVAYENFYKDIAIKDKKVIWMNYNLSSLETYWQNNNLLNTTFANKYGITFSDVAQLKYNRVKYKNTELYKGVIPFATPGSASEGCILEGDNRYDCSLELNRINILNQNKVDVFATATSTINNGNTPVSPYITKAGNFWFVGDIPFTYMSEEDRYLAFSDVLHDMLEIPHQEMHKAIMRLEDVDARTKLNDLNSIASYMGSKNIPFSVATIPRYEDPLGIENNGVATTQLLSNSVIGTRLKELYDAGAITIVQHGTTHQYYKSLDDNISEISNPYNGLSGDDFEFMRVIENADLSYSYLYPVENDSAVWAKARITEGINIFNDIGITAFAWEAPHYMAGPNHYRGIKELYPVQYARVLYFPNEDSNDSAIRNKFIGQFYPYIIQKDLYGYTIIPENIHNIVNVPNEGYRSLLPADTIRFAKKLKVVRDGVASFYYHPFLGTGYLQQIVEGLEAEGYTFVSAPSLVE
ncbi:hypothetical protein MNB_SV-13-983 [hydrothermal vent metagenome]|uniref:D-glucuronyl C5-epimerase beta-sandwich domain-containing protein n=1 Tax=hydrothermal vent metagenome TaxID=652676 RepID=A0A1W1BGX6_9ZZZZ